MPRYQVTHDRTELYRYTIYVDAASIQDARDLVEDGGGEDDAYPKHLETIGSEVTDVKLA